MVQQLKYHTSLVFEEDVLQLGDLDGLAIVFVISSSFSCLGVLFPVESGVLYKLSNLFDSDELMLSLVELFLKR